MVAFAKDAGIAEDNSTLKPMDMVPTACGQVNPSQEMEPTPNGKSNVFASQLLPVKC
jgi:hypothetical protein